MSDLHVRFKAYDSAGVFQGFLTPSSWSASVQHNDAGTLSMTYPRVALNGGILQRGLEQGLEIGMEVATHDAWVEPYNCRFLLVSRSRDAKDSTDTVTLNCMTWIWLTKKILNLNMSALLTDTDNKGKRPFYSATSGMIVHTLLDENRRRGGAATVMPAGFNSARDTNGDTWAYKMTLYYDAGVDLYTVIDNLSANGMCDWRTDGRMLKMWNADSTALCRDLSARVRIPLATGLLESPEEETIEGLAGNILVRGDNDLVFTQENKTAPSPWGKWELYSSQGGVSNKDTAQLLMQTQLASAARVRGQYTRQILTTGIEHLPLVDYRPGDWITAPTVNHGEKVRVQRVELSNRNDGGVKCALMLNDRLYDAQTRQAKRIQGITGGAVAGGASGATPAPEKDHRIPMAPAGLVVQTDAYIDANGYARGLATAQWAEVTQATNHTSIEITSYRVEWRPNIAGEAWRSAGVTTDTTLSWGNLDCGTTIQVRVRAVPTYSDKLGDWSAVAVVDVAQDVTPPSVPSVPVLASELGVVTIHWDGRTATGTHMEPDFDHIEVGRGTNPSNLTRIAVAQSGEGDYLDTALTVGDEPVYALRAVDHAGNMSAWSTTAGITVTSTVSPEEISQIKNDLKANNDALETANQTLSQAEKDIQANSQAITSVNQTLTQTNKTLEEANQTLSQANKDLAQAKKDIKANADKAKESYDKATNAQTTADGKNKIIKSTGEPAHAGLATGDMWYQTSLVTWWTGEPNNSPSVLSERVDHVYIWDGTQFNEYNFVASNVISTNTVTAPLLAAGSIITDKLAANAVTADKILTGAVTTDKLAANAVVSDKIAANAVTAGKVAAEAISSREIKALAISTDKLTANAVTTAKIAALAITADKIAANAITTDKIKAGQFVGYVFTGAVYQSHTEDNKGFKLRGNSFDMWDASQNNTIHLDGSGASNLIVGELDTKLSGDRVRIRPSFYTSTVGSDATQQGAGIDFPLQGTYARTPYIATESLDSEKGPISTLTLNSGMRTDGSAGAGTGFGSFFRLGQTRDSNNKEMACAFLTANCDYLNLSQDTNRRQWKTYINLTTISGEGTNAYITARKPGGYAACNLVGGDGRDTRAAIVAGDGNGEVGMECNINTGYLYLGGFLGLITGRGTLSANWVEGTNHIKPYTAMTHTITLPAPKYGRYKSIAVLNNNKGNAYFSSTTCNEKSGSFQVIIRSFPQTLSGNTSYGFFPSGGADYWLTSLSYLIK